MRTTCLGITPRFGITLTCCLFASPLCLGAGQKARPVGVDHHHHVGTVSVLRQGTRLAGRGRQFVHVRGPHTMQVCLTQEQIDRYGADSAHKPQLPVANVVKGAHGMTADWVCSGMMSGKGTLESSWVDDSHAKGKVHFIGSIQAGPSPKPIEFTAESTSVFKSADCGNVKPLAPPVPTPNK